MIKKEKIFKNFLRHPILVKKYDLSKDDLNLKLNDGLNSKNKAVKTLAFIVDSLESNKPKSDKQLDIQIRQLLNEMV